MEKHLPPPGIPCPFLKVGQCPYGDGCEYAHDFMAQPCLSSAQIDYQMRSLEHARPADRNERAKVKRRKAQLRRLGARKLAAPALFERGVVPTKKAIKRELGRYTVGPPNNITFLAVREKVFMDGGADDDDDDDGEWQTVGINRLRRKRKIVARMGQRNVRILGMSRRSGANGNPPARADLEVRAGAPGICLPSPGDAPPGNSITPGNMDVDQEEVDISRRIEIIGDFTVKYPISIPSHLQHRYPNAPPATINSPLPQKQLPYTDEGINYAPTGEIVREIEKERVTRGRALSF